MEKREQTMFAYAKINLSLAVLATLPNGFHEIQSVMQSIDLWDHVQVSLREEKGIQCLCGTLSGPENLAYRAAELFLSGRDLRTGVAITITKNIPVQAGLGGGSADGAATLRALNLLFREPYSAQELRELGAKLGADVAFCLDGGTQWATGIGEQLMPLAEPPLLDLILVKPEQGINTGEAYRLFDEVGISHPLSLNAWREALDSGLKERVLPLLSNDLEQASVRLMPIIAQIKEDLLRAGCPTALMSGSGSAVFGVANSPEQAREIAKGFREKGFSVWVTRTIGRREG